MKALTICQPYASLICLPASDPRHKAVENRTWPTGYRAPLAIHAGKSRSWLCLSADGLRDEEYGIPLSEMAFGCVVALARLAQCIPIEACHRGALYGSLYSWVPDHRHTEGPFCWVLENVVRLPEPIPARGAQGLWEWQEPANVRELLEQAR